MRSKAYWKQADLILAVRKLQHDRAASAQAQADHALEVAHSAVRRLEVELVQANADWSRATSSGSILDPFVYAGFSQRFEQFLSVGDDAEDAVLNAKRAQAARRESTKASLLLLDLARQTARRAWRRHRRAQEERQWNAFEESGKAQGAIE